MADLAPHLEAVEAAAWQEFQQAVERELARLAEQGNYQRRRSTILALALAEVTPGQSWHSALSGPDTVSQQTFYSRKKDWYAGTTETATLFREVLANVIRLYHAYYGGQDMRRQEARRQAHIAGMLELTDAGMERLRQMLQFPVADRTLKDGTLVVSPTFTWSQAATLLATVDKHARLALGLHTDSTKSRLDVASLSDEELDALADGG